MLTQEDYKLYTGQNICYADSEWKTVVNIAQIRLASLLCLDTFPELSEDNQDLALLLASFICATLKYQGAPDVISSKSVRNFTINFNNSATNAFEQIYNQYRDIIEKYNNCGNKTGLKVERSAPCCGRFNNGLINF